MNVVSDGFEFKLYLEGIQTPFVSARLTYQGADATAAIQMFPSTNFKNIKTSTLVHIFFKQSGIVGSDPEHQGAGNFKLLFTGYVAGKAIAQSGGDRGYTLVCHNRFGLLKSIMLGSVFSRDFVGELNRIVTKTAVRAATVDDTRAGGTGLAGIFNPSQVPGEVAEESIPEKAPYFQDLNEKKVASGSAEDGVITTETNSSANPATPASNDVTTPKPAKKQIVRSLENPNILKDGLDAIIKDACQSSSPVYQVAYSHRLKLDRYINEFPATWANYIAQDDAKRNKMHKYVSQVINQTMSSVSQLSSLASVLLNLFNSECWEIPGLFEGGMLIQPVYMASDIPTCNMLFPSEIISINFTDMDGNKITRLITKAEDGYIPSDQVPQSSQNSTKQISVALVSAYPPVFNIRDVTVPQDKKTSLNKMQTLLIEGEEYTGPRTLVTAPSPDYAIVSSDQASQYDLTEQQFYLIKDVHKNMSAQLKFSYNLIPGQKAVLFDKYTPLVGKITSITHDISAASVSTSVNFSQVEYLDDIVLRHPHWYDASYKPENIDSIYAAYFGCHSMSSSAGMPGKIKEAYKYLYEKYLTCELKSYMAAKLTQRFFETEASVFKMLGVSNTQATSDKGVLIYTGQLLDNYRFSGYTLDMSPTTIESDRQLPVLEYVKTIYGVIGDSYD